MSLSYERLHGRKDTEIWVTIHEKPLEWRKMRMGPLDNELPTLASPFLLLDPKEMFRISHNTLNSESSPPTLSKCPWRRIKTQSQNWTAWKQAVQSFNLPILLFPTHVPLMCQLLRNLLVELLWILWSPLLSTTSHRQSMCWILWGKVPDEAENVNNFFFTYPLQQPPGLQWVSSDQCQWFSWQMSKDTLGGSGWEG